MILNEGVEVEKSERRPSKDAKANEGAEFDISDDNCDFCHKYWEENDDEIYNVLELTLPIPPPLQPPIIPNSQSI